MRSDGVCDGGDGDFASGDVSAAPGGSGRRGGAMLIDF